jgi:hypothetical protein
VRTHSRETERKRTKHRTEQTEQNGERACTKKKKCGSKCFFCNRNRSNK